MSSLESEWVPQEEVDPRARDGKKGSGTNGTAALFSESGRSIKIRG